MNRRDRFDDDDSDHQESEPRPNRRSEERARTVRTSAQAAVERASSRGQRSESKAGLASNPGLLIGAFIAGLMVLALVIYLIVSQTSQPAPAPATPQPTAQQQPSAPQTPPQQSTQPESATGAGFFDFLNSPTTTPVPDEPWLTTAARILLKLALAALLSAMLAFRPRKDLPASQRNPYVGQTQILLAVVASALMMVVADNAARAFGIFAAASLVRFRTNIRDPKEITVLLASLAIGLATGVGRIEVGIILTLFVLVMLWVLEYYEPSQVFRAMELTITSRRVDETDEMLREIFEKRNITSEIRKVDREDEDNPMGKIVYYVNVNPVVSTDQLSEEIFASDPDNIDSIQWDQKKSTSYIYR